MVPSHAKIVTLRGAKRGSAGVPVAECGAAGNETLSPEPSKNLSKNFQVRSQIDLKGFLETILDQSILKITERRPKRGPRSPRGVQEKEKTSPEAPQILPKPPKLDPKSVQKASWKPCWANAFKKLDFQHQKKRSRGAQERPQTTKRRPREAPKRPKPLPNGAQDPAKSNF